MVNRQMPRIQEVLLPYLREQMPEVMFTSWVPKVESRRFPLVNIRRLGGLPVHPRLLDAPVVEVTSYATEDLAQAENIYLDVRTLIFDMVDLQIVTEAGYLHSYFETLGPTQFDSPFEDSWRVQGLIQLGLRPPRI